jgi:tryptophan-rich sensory protein
MNKKHISALIFFLLVTFLAAFIGNFFTMPSIQDWYASLSKPSFNPPNWLFGPAWTILYFLMAVSAFLVWQKRENPRAKKALTFYFIQLALNSLWSIIFFGWQNLGLAFVEIIFLWLFILLTLINFYKIVRVAGILFIPYILWVSFASLLNFSIWQLNL